MACDQKVVLFRARYSSWKKAIVRVEVDRATDSSIWIDGRRHPRKITDSRVFDDFESAKIWLIDRLSTEAANLEGKLKKMRDEIDRVGLIQENGIPTDNACY